MRLFATTAALCAAMVFNPASAQETISTGTVETALFGNGNIGDAACDAPGVNGFVFNGEDGLCGAAFMLALASDNVIGVAYTDTNDSEWEPDSTGESTEFPYDGLDQGVMAAFSDAGGLGINVVANAYWAENTDFVVFDYQITNNTGSELADVYPGLWVDWDLDQAMNEGRVNEAASAFYVWDEQSGGQNYFGQAVLTGPLSGWTCFIDYTHTDAAEYTGLSTPGPQSCSNMDIRGTYGTGPITIADGETARVAFALIAGEDEEDFLTNTNEVRNLVAPQSDIVINTGTVETRLYADGSFGDDTCDTGATGFIFDGADLLCGAVFQFGLNSSLVIGAPYANSPNVENSEWAPGGTGVATSFPYEALDQGASATFSDLQGIGIGVSLNAYWAEDTDYVLLDYTITNNTFSNLEQTAAGMWLDWDIGNYAENSMIVDTERNLQYVWDASNPNSSYGGQMFLGSELVGWTCFYDYVNDPNDSVMWSTMTTPGVESCNGIGAAIPDIRGPVGTGPLTIAAGQSVKVTIAVLAGEDEEDLLANADAARLAYGDEIVSNDAPVEGPAVDRLAQAYPNPVAGVARLNLELATAQHVRVAVYDALGRQVAVVHDGAAPTGTQELSFDARSLPSGTYVLRAVGDTFSATQRVTVVR